MPSPSSGAVYPRERGGDIIGPIEGICHEGLSPRTRGRHRKGLSVVSGEGSIPANAGETAKRGCRTRWIGVYPRERGGDTRGRTGRARRPGLSPRTRGRRCGHKPGDHGYGSIPANAGETWLVYHTHDSRRVYPRERGGDLVDDVAQDAKMGLSPRTRGRPRVAASWMVARGSIPANAGETLSQRTRSTSRRVYPRERGGDHPARQRLRKGAGLSPRTRGRPGVDFIYDIAKGSIPANAGETDSTRCAASRSRVYPRERGGDALTLDANARGEGLSPRTRGRPSRALALPTLRGSIPANAGETSARVLRGRTQRVYPRERGGDAGQRGPAHLCAGLSPRTRGRRKPLARIRQKGGSIPANAGETARSARGLGMQGVYPRERGGDAPMMTRGVPWAGLSPRTRGRPRLHG